MKSRGDGRSIVIISYARSQLTDVKIMSSKIVVYWIALTVRSVVFAFTVNFASFRREVRISVTASVTVMGSQFTVTVRMDLYLG